MAKKSPAENTGQYKKQADLFKELNAASETLGLTEQSRVKAADAILDRTIKTKQAFDEYINALVIAEEKEAAIVRTQDKKNAAKQKEADILNIVDEVIDDIKAKQKDILAVDKESADATRQQIADKKKEIAILVSKGDISAQAAEAMRQELANQELALNATEATANKARQANAEVQEFIKGSKEKVDAIMKALPIPEFVKNAFGFDDMFAAASKGAEAFAKEFATNMIAGKGMTASLTAGMKAFNAVAALNPMALVVIAIAGAATAMASLISAASKNEKMARDTAEAMGVSVLEAKAMLKNAQKVVDASNQHLVSVQDVLDVQKQIGDELGNSALISAKTAADTAAIGDAFGYGATEAAKVNAQFMTMGMSAEDATNAQRELAAEATAAGLDTAKVIEDITKNANLATKFFGGNTKELRKAAIQAAKLGVSIEDMVSVSDSLLNIEESLAAQFEFQALSGKQINLDKARELALAGDIAGATKLVLEQTGGIAEFNKMSVLERKKLAEATGMEVGQLQKSLAIQEKMPNASAAQLGLLEKMGLSAEEIANMSDKELQSRLSSQQQTEKLNTGFNNLKSTLKKALVPAGEALLSAFELLLPVMKIVGAVMKVAFMPLTIAGKALKKLVDLAKEYSTITAGILGILTLITIKQKEEMILETAKNAKKSAGYAIDQAILGIKALTNAETYKGIALTTAGLAKQAASGAMVLAKAVGTIFSSLGQIPFGLGLLAAGGAVAAMFGLYKKAQSTGDLSMGANGGPIVASPREGTIFQGTKNDELAMGPGVIDAAQGGGGGLFGSIGSAVGSLLGGGESGTAQAIQEQNAILRQILSAMNNPPPVQVGSKVIKELNAQIEVERSFTRAT